MRQPLTPPNDGKAYVEMAVVTAPFIDGTSIRKPGKGSLQQALVVTVSGRRWPNLGAAARKETRTTSWGSKAAVMGKSMSRCPYRMDPGNAVPSWLTAQKQMGENGHHCDVLQRTTQPRVSCMAAIGYACSFARTDRKAMDCAGIAKHVKVGTKEAVCTRAISWHSFLVPAVGGSQLAKMLQDESKSPLMRATAKQKGWA